MCHVIDHIGEGIRAFFKTCARSMILLYFYCFRGKIPCFITCILIIIIDIIINIVFIIIMTNIKATVKSIVKTFTS